MKEEIRKIRSGVSAVVIILTSRPPHAIFAFQWTAVGFFSKSTSLFNTILADGFSNIDEYIHIFFRDFNVPFCVFSTASLSLVLTNFTVRRSLCYRICRHLLPLYWPGFTMIMSSHSALLGSFICQFTTIRMKLKCLCYLAAALLWLCHPYPISISYIYRSTHHS
jgi:hypothetical protein